VWWTLGEGLGGEGAVAEMARTQCITRHTALPRLAAKGNASMLATRIAALIPGACLLWLASVGPLGAQPVAKVNGQPIDQSDLYTYMVKRHGYRSLLNLITAEVIRQQAAKQGITVPDQEIEQSITRKRESLNRTAIETGADFDAMLASQHQTLQMFTESERTLLLLKRMVSGEVQVTDANVREFYQKNQEDYKLREAMRVSYIRLDDAEQATEVRQNIINGNITFEQAAKEYSKDPYTKDQGGKLDRWLTRGRTPFLQAAFSLLQDGDVSDVVPFPGLGLYLIRRDEYVRDYQLDFDEIESDLKELLADQLTQRLAFAKQRELLEAAKVEFLIEWPEGTWPPDAGKTLPPEEATVSNP
jgi:foldase protein PrsA